MLKANFADQLTLGLAQAALAALLALAVMRMARTRGIQLEWETMVALIRGILQIVAVGGAILLLLSGPRWTSVLLLVGMVTAAAATSARRAKQIPGAWRVSLCAIGVGAGSVIAIMTWAGAIDTAITALVPVGSMLISNAMNTNSLVLNRFRSEVESHIGHVETALALGAGTKDSVAPYARASFEASLIPAIDSLRSLGIVWVPGLMTGMLLSGAHPVYAAVYQFVTIAMILAASGLTSFVSTLLIRSRAFSPAEQLTLRPPVAGSAGR
jgi:putative ABC transport system permease protein